MHTIVNHLPIRADADWTALAGKMHAFLTATRKTVPKLRGGLVVKVSDGEAILIVFYEDEATMNEVSSKIAAPWFAENIRPYLAGPVSRSVGAVVAGEWESSG
jgi:hypothetical protein